MVGTVRLRVISRVPVVDIVIAIVTAANVVAGVTVVAQVRRPGSSHVSRRTGDTEGATKIVRQMTDEVAVQQSETPRVGAA